MAILKHRKYYLDNRRLCLLSLFIVFALNVKAGSYGTLEVEVHDDPLIKDVSYTYQLFYNNQNQLDCSGTLSLSLSLPEDAERLLFLCTIGHITDPDNRLFFKFKSEWPLATELTLSSLDICWGTYFRVQVFLADGSYVISSIHPINDYIDPVDLDSILGSASVEDLNDDSTILYVKDKQLYVDSPDALSLSLFDLCGKRIFSGAIGQAMVIPLDNVSSPFIIARYSTPTITKTTKLSVR